MNAVPLISIIIPAYNTEETLAKCLSSVLAQSFENFEVLLVDDGSTDDTFTICKEYAEKDPRIKLFQQENGGSSKARNTALAHVRTDWLTFCDADDWVDEHWLQCFVDHMDEGDLIIQGFLCANWPGGRTAFGVDEKLVDKGDIVQELHHQDIRGFLWCKMFRTDLVRRAGITFHERVTHREDEVFVMQYFCAVDSVKTVSEGHYHYICPDNYAKYFKRQSVISFTRLFSAAKEIFGSSYTSNTLVLYYFELGTIQLMREYANRSDIRREMLDLYMQYCAGDISGIKFRRKLFKPLYLAFGLRSPTAAHWVLTAYSSLPRVKRQLEK